MLILHFPLITSRLRILHEEPSDLLNIVDRKTLTLAVLLRSLESIAAFVERDQFGHSGFIIHIEDIVILSRLEEFVTLIVTRVRASARLSQHLSYFFPATILPHVALRDLLVAKHLDVSFFPALNYIYIIL